MTRIIKGTTSTGFNFEISTDNLDNMEVIDLMAEAENDANPSVISKLSTLILGVEQKKALYDHIRKNGRVSATVFMQEFSEILNTNNEDDDIKK